ncbi:CgeB family protein [Pseudoroseicyclus aestuarii]|uniref:Spore maturation protein CgeB n=1 Tax=Pseudoroseicyclus aestuarii TaxID=1795041 RepID=A0A318SPT8_9RHOB|nr:glycosyltransferase [Pseudoroseicyclus aestuarii]PYE83682.1 spore maturation protein CgeB [Pseudoroseicyclus aestuarii]
MSGEIVILGLSLSSSWGNGHATTFRALIRGLAAEGQRVLFLERDVPWYASQRDLPDPDFCELRLYHSLDEVFGTYGERLRDAAAVIVGSYVPEGQALIDRLHEAAQAGRIAQPFCFYDIDTPVTLEHLRAGREDHLARRQVPFFDTYFSFSGGRVLDVLRRDFGARDPRPLYCAVDEARYAPMDLPATWDLGYLGTYSPDRQPPLEQLLIEPARRLPQMRFVVAGPQYPDDIDWPENVERIDHLPPSEHAAFYGAQRFTLNVTRSAMKALGWSPSVRLFEAAACGTPIVSDRWEGLGEVLPEGEAILVADSTEDVVTALTTMTPPQRQRQADAARARVQAAHTGRARARQLIADLAEAPAHRLQGTGS